MRIKIRDILMTIDREDYEYVSNRKWCLTNGYLSRREGNKVIYLHRELMDTPLGMVTDHINGNILDNRKSNLRVCTQQENTYNQKTRKDSTTGYRGVNYYKARDLYQVRISFNKRTKHIGYFKNLSEAVSAYRDAALRYHGKFVRQG